MALKEAAIRDGDTSHERRMEMLAELVGSTAWAYAPAFYEFDYHADGTIAAVNRTRSDVPHADRKPARSRRTSTRSRCRRSRSCSFVQTPHDRIAIEIMRGCPWQCRFCQSTVIKRPLRVRSVETIVQAALESYRNTGHERDQPAVALEQRLPALRGTGAADARGVRAAGRERVAAEPAREPPTAQRAAS